MDDIELRKQKQRIASRKYQARHAERVREKNKQYRSTPEAKEKHRIKMAEWRLANPEKQKMVSLKTREKHKERVNALRREKNKSDPDYNAKKKASDKRYAATGKRVDQYWANREECLKRSARYKATHRDQEIKRMEKYRKENIDSIRLKDQIERDTCDPKYVVRVIKKQTGFKVKTKDIPAELIEQKRITLLLKRQTKNNDNTNTHLRSH